MAEVFLTFFLQKLHGQLTQELKLRSEAREGVQWVRDELEFIKVFLEDAERRGDQREKGVEAWITQVRHLAFDAEDAIDEYLIRMEMQCGPASFIMRFKDQRQFGIQVQKFRIMVKEIHERREHYRFQITQETASILVDDGHPDPGVAAPWVEEPDIMGLEEASEQLMNLLTEEQTQQRTIISIVGMGGLGKTTLAKKLYKTAKVSFECHAWIYVSQQFKIDIILRRMLAEFCQSRKESPPNSMEKMHRDKLRRTIHNYLEGREYALVLDDIWDICVWDDVKHALPHEGRGKIIFTTRMQNVASPVGEICSIHELKPLSDDLAWELFCRKAFWDKEPKGTCPRHLIGVGEALVRRCKGLPLAIVAIGGLMSKKSMDAFEWNNVLKNPHWELSHNEDLARLNEALLMSYRYLTPHLKYCFSCCGMFPEDHVIKKKKLIRIWVAEGFVEESPGKTLEEVSSDYFVQLINRNLLQPIIDDFTGKLIACQVHDLMRDIAIYMFKKEGFGTIITKQDTKVDGKQRHLAIQNCEIGILSSMVGLNPRSLFVFNVNDFPSSLCKTLLDFKLLRVLDLDGIQVKNLPDEVGGLIHLRYLSLRSTQIENLPTSIGRLHNLQTLDVRHSNLQCLPAGIEMLMQLRHLLLIRYLKMPSGAINLRNLQTLSGAFLDDRLLRELGQLTQLRKLKVGDVKEECCAQLCNSISQLQHLRSLKITCSNENEPLQLQTVSRPPQYLEKLLLLGVMEELPVWVGSLNSVRVITFGFTQLTSDPLTALGHLPNLVYLLLLQNAYTGKKIGCTVGGFPKLRTLSLQKMEALEEWSSIDEGTMPCLHYLHISKCPNLKMLPDGFQHLAALQRLALEDMGEEFMDRVKKGGEDHFKVQNVRRIFRSRHVDGNWSSMSCHDDQTSCNQSSSYPASNEKLYVPLSLCHSVTRGEAYWVLTLLTRDGGSLPGSVGHTITSVFNPRRPSILTYHFTL